METRKKRKSIEIGDHVKETVSSKGQKRRCGEVLMILQDDPGDPTCELVEVNPDDLSPLEKGSDGVKLFKTKRSKLKHYTPIKQLFSRKTFEKGDVIQQNKVLVSGTAGSFALFIQMAFIQNHMRKDTMAKIF